MNANSINKNQNYNDSYETNKNLGNSNIFENSYLESRKRKFSVPNKQNIIKNSIASEDKKGKIIKNAEDIKLTEIKNNLGDEDRTKLIINQTENNLELKNGDLFQKKSKYLLNTLLISKISFSNELKENKIIACNLQAVHQKIENLMKIDENQNVFNFEIENRKKLANKSLNNSQERSIYKGFSESLSIDSYSEINDINSYFYVAQIKKIIGLLEEKLLNLKKKYMFRFFLKLKIFIRNNIVKTNILLVLASKYFSLRNVFESRKLKYEDKPILIKLFLKRWKNTVSLFPYYERRKIILNGIYANSLYNIYFSQNMKRKKIIVQNIFYALKIPLTLIQESYKIFIKICLFQMKLAMIFQKEAFFSKFFLSKYHYMELKKQILYSCNNLQINKNDSFIFNRIKEIKIKELLYRLINKKELYNYYVHVKIYYIFHKFYWNVLLCKLESLKANHIAIKANLKKYLVVYIQVFLLQMEKCIKREFLEKIKHKGKVRRIENYLKYESSTNSLINNKLDSLYKLDIWYILNNIKKREKREVKWTFLFWLLKIRLSPPKITNKKYIKNIYRILFPLVSIFLKKKKLIFEDLKRFSKQVRIQHIKIAFISRRFSTYCIKKKGKIFLRKFRRCSIVKKVYNNFQIQKNTKKFIEILSAIYLKYARYFILIFSRKYLYNHQFNIFDCIFSMRKTISNIVIKRIFKKIKKIKRKKKEKENISNNLILNNQIEICNIMNESILYEMKNISIGNIIYKLNKSRRKKFYYINQYLIKWKNFIFIDPSLVFTSKLKPIEIKRKIEEYTNDLKIYKQKLYMIRQKASNCSHCQEYLIKNLEKEYKKKVNKSVLRDDLSNLSISNNSLKESPSETIKNIKIMETHDNDIMKLQKNSKNDIVNISQNKVLIDNNLNEIIADEEVPSFINCSNTLNKRMINSVNHNDFSFGDNNEYNLFNSLSKNTLNYTKDEFIYNEDSQKNDINDKSLFKSLKNEENQAKHNLINQKEKYSVIIQKLENEINALCEELEGKI